VEGLIIVNSYNESGVLIFEQVNLDKDCKGNEIVFAILETLVVSYLKSFL